MRIIKDVVPGIHHHYEARDLNAHESYEAWVTASTRIGQGPSTPVIKLAPSPHIPAAIITFGQSLTVAWRVDVRLACLYVGEPKPHPEWKSLNTATKSSSSAASSATSSSNTAFKQHLEVGDENTLTLRNVQRHHRGNYSCHVHNRLGSDQIVYQLIVQVPPEPPEMRVTSVTSATVALEWKTADNGGAPLHGFVLAHRHETGEWSETPLDRHATSFLLDGLQCGTRYQLTLAAHNKIGSGAASRVEQTRTRGEKPIAPQRQHLIRANVTSIALELAAWQDGGCAIIGFTVEFRRQRGALGGAGGSAAMMGTDWIVVSSNVAPQSRFAIPDLEPATAYSLRVTAHNNAGATVAEFAFDTLPIGGVAATGRGGGGAGGALGADGQARGGDDVDMDGAEQQRLWSGGLALPLAVLLGFVACVAALTTCFCLYASEYQKVC